MRCVPCFHSCSTPPVVFINKSGEGEQGWRGEKGWRVDGGGDGEGE